MNKAELEELAEFQRNQIAALTASHDKMAGELTEARKAPAHEHDLVPIGEPYEKTEFENAKKTDRLRRYQTLYCRRCPQTYEIIVTDHRAVRGGS